MFTRKIFVVHLLKPIRIQPWQTIKMQALKTSNKCEGIQLISNKVKNRICRLVRRLRQLNSDKVLNSNNNISNNSLKPKTLIWKIQIISLRLFNKLRIPRILKLQDLHFQMELFSQCRIPSTDVITIQTSKMWASWSSMQPINRPTTDPLAVSTCSKIWISLTI